MKKTIYWAVTAKCGHVGGVSKYIPITFYIQAETKKEASNKVIDIPRVKHNNKQVILGIENISYEDYINGIRRNNNDPYLRCQNIQEQKCNFEEIYDRILDEDDKWCLDRSAWLHKRNNIEKPNMNKKRSAIKDKFTWNMFDCESDMLQFA